MTNHHRALIVIDMQKGMQSATLGRRNNLHAEANFQQLRAHWRRLNWPIVHTRHMSRSRDSAFWPGQVGAEFQDAFLPLDSEHVMEKNVTDAFANSGLERWLLARDIKDLVIVGASNNMSVEATVRSAGSLGFRAVETCACGVTSQLLPPRRPPLKFKVPPQPSQGCQSLAQVNRLSIIQSQPPTHHTIQIPDQHGHGQHPQHDHAKP
jgi:nicotinamidase-related amidase